MLWKVCCLLNLFLLPLRLPRMLKLLRACKVVEEEAALAGVQGKLQGIKDQILAALREEADCRERTRKRGTDSGGMEDAVTVDEGGSSGEVGTEVEKR